MTVGCDTLTVSVQIGNSDDKLTQKEWSEFVQSIGDSIITYKGHIHFCGGSMCQVPWQNFCWVFELENNDMVVDALREQQKRIRVKYRQDSVAWLSGVTRFI